MALSEIQLLRLALSSYEAATEPELWPAFLKGCVDGLRADSAVLQIHDFRQYKSTIISSFGVNSHLKVSYNEHYGKVNVWRNQGFARGRYVAGRTNLSEELCPRPLLEHSQFYNEYLLPLDGVNCLGAVIAVKNSCAPTLTVLRGRRKSAFLETERKIAEFLLPHLARAWSVYHRLDVLRAAQSVLDSLSYGIAFLDASGSVVYCNHFAERVLRAGDGLSISGGRLCANDRLAEADLKQVLVEAPSLGTPSCAVSVPRPSSHRAYQVVAAPLRTTPPQLAGIPTPSLVVFIVDPEIARPANTDVLNQLFGLTVKEAVVAQKLSQGKTVEQVAEELEIRYETARTHLRRIFSKTQTSRQSELVLLLERLPLTKEN
jgi:DNA-binding CsgD family transcriptional regulator/PAS domain-containing protein